MLHFSTSSILFATCIILLGGIDASSEEPGSAPAWPCWLGANHDGVSEESDWSTEWPDSGLPIRWSKEIGIGFSSVSIVDGLLYTMGHVDGDEYVRCLDASSGDEVWQYKYECKLIDNLYEGGPGSTPTIDSGRVYTLGKEGQFCCFDAKTGEVIWRKDLKAELGVRTPEWGFNSSGYIWNGQIIFEAGRVVSYDKKSGEKLWESDRHRAGYGSVAVVPDPEGDLIVSLDCESVRVTNPRDGSTVDSFPWKSPFRTNSTSPIVSNGKIFVSTGYQVGCGLFDWKDGSLDLVYDNRDMRNHFNNSILYQGYLYGFDGNSNLGRVVHLTCMDWKTGKVMWKRKGMGCGSLMIAGGRLVILSDAGELVVADASPKEYLEIARTRILDGRCWTVPVLLGNRVFARNAAGTLVCAQLK